MPYDSPPASPGNEAPTIMYDTERRSRQQSLLDPPDVAALLRSKRKWWRGGCAAPTFPRPLRLLLMCTSIALSAMHANGVYCWPTYGPVVIKRFGLNDGQAQTIVAGGILGVYLCAAPLGALVDRYGPQTGSLLSACFAAVGYLTFAALVRAGPSGDPYQYLALTACYFSIGAATVGSYFAALTTASLSFPSHPTLSLSLPLSLIGLSPLVLSSFSTLPVFEGKGGDINAVKYLSFLGVLSVSVNLFGAVFMRVTPPLPRKREHHHVVDDSDVESVFSYVSYDNDYADLSASLHLDERTPLLIGGPEAAREEVENQLQGKDVRWSTVGLLRNKGFWVFGLIITGSIGPSETLMASIGTILTALLPPDAHSFSSALRIFSGWQGATMSVTAVDTALLLRNKHVFILSISSTLSRLVVGFAADALAPAPTAVPAPHSDDIDAPTHYFVQKKPVILHRSALTAICATALAVVYAWSAAFLDAESRLWILSGGVGTLYGALFTLTPAIVSTHFGPTNFGLAWGMVSYFPALGSTIFSYLFAHFAESGATPALAEHTVCYGRRCFDGALWIAAAGSLTAAIGFFLIGRRWKV